MQSELSARESITETLRAQTHEFNNQLHTISGLIQLEEYAELSQWIGAVTRRRAEITEEVTSHIDDPAVAALLIAKVSLAAERGIGLRLAEDAALPRLDPDLRRRRRHRARQPRRQRGRRHGVRRRYVDRRPAPRGRRPGARAGGRQRRRRARGHRGRCSAAATRPSPATPAAGVSGWRWCRWSASVGAARCRCTMTEAPSSPPGCPMTEEAHDHRPDRARRRRRLHGRRHPHEVRAAHAGVRGGGRGGDGRGRAGGDPAAASGPGAARRTPARPHRDRRAPRAAGRGRRHRRGDGDRGARGRDGAGRGGRGSGALPGEAVRVRRPARPARGVPGRAHRAGRRGTGRPGRHRRGVRAGGDHPAAGAAQGAERARPPTPSSRRSAGPGSCPPARPPRRSASRGSRPGGTSSTSSTPARSRCA